MRRESSPHPTLMHRVPGKTRLGSGSNQQVHVQENQLTHNPGGETCDTHLQADNQEKASCSRTLPHVCRRRWWSHPCPCKMELPGLALDHEHRCFWYGSQRNNGGGFEWEWRQQWRLCNPSRLTVTPQPQSGALAAGTRVPDNTFVTAFLQTLGCPKKS